MAIKPHTTVFQASREDDRARTVKAAHVYSFASVATNDFTYPISLAGAKSVWVSLASTEDATYYLPLYDAGAIDVDSAPTDLMSASFTLSGKGVGVDVMFPSAAGAGFIGGNCMPPALSVKLTGTTTQTILIHITY